MNLHLICDSSGVGNFFKSIGSSIKGLFSKKQSNSDGEDGFKNKIKENKGINIQKIINEQNFVEGYWEINENTKEKYEKKFKLLKELKDKNINDNIVITILIIYFINKEHYELLNELFMIIEKEKNYIKKNTKNSYENIIKIIGL